MKIMVYPPSDGRGRGFLEVDLSDRSAVLPNPADGKVHIRLEDPLYSGTVFYYRNHRYGRPDLLGSGSVHHCLESFRVVHGQVGQHFTVEPDILFIEKSHQS